MTVPSERISSKRERERKRETKPVDSIVEQFPERSPASPIRIVPRTKVTSRDERSLIVIDTPPSLDTRGRPRVSQSSGRV